VQQQGLEVSIHVFGVAKLFQLFQDDQGFRRPAAVHQADGFQRPQPGEVRTKNGGHAVLLEGFFAITGRFQSLGVKGPAQGQIRMQFEGLAGDGQSLRQFPAEQTHKNFGRRKVHRQRVDRTDLLHLCEGLIQASGAGIEHGQAYVSGRPPGLFPQRLQEICLGFRGFVFKNVQALGAIGA
jgi:hypothetical protein